MGVLIPPNRYSSTLLGKSLRGGPGETVLSPFSSLSLPHLLLSHSFISTRDFTAGSKPSSVPQICHPQTEPHQHLWGQPLQFPASQFCLLTSTGHLAFSPPLTFFSYLELVITPTVPSVIFSAVVLLSDHSFQSSQVLHPLTTTTSVLQPQQVLLGLDLPISPTTLTLPGCRAILKSPDTASQHLPMPSDPSAPPASSSLLEEPQPSLIPPAVSTRPAPAPPVRPEKTKRVVN